MGLVNIQNTNFENGITNRNAADLFGSMGQLDPTKFNTLMEDFNGLPSFNNSTGRYTVPATGTILLADVLGGGMTQTTGASAGNVNIVQSISLGYSLIASFRTYFRTKLSITDVTDSIVMAGLADAVAGITPADGIFFQKLDTVETLDLVVRSGSSEIAIASAISTPVDATQFTAEFYWDGIDRVYYGIDGVPQGFIDLNGLTLPAGLLATTIGLISGAGAGAKVQVVDYLFTAQER